MDQLFAKIAVASFGNAVTGELISTARLARGKSHPHRELSTTVELCTIANGAIDGGRINWTDARNAQQYLTQRMLMGHFR